MPRVRLRLICIRGSPGERSPGLLCFSRPRRLDRWGVWRERAGRQGRRRPLACGWRGRGAARPLCRGSGRCGRRGDAPVPRCTGRSSPRRSRSSPTRAAWRRATRTGGTARLSATDCQTNAPPRRIRLPRRGDFACWRVGARGDFRLSPGPNMLSCRIRWTDC